MSDNHVLVVGGTRGIGLAIASRFAAAGNHVSVIARRPPALTALAFFEANLEDESAIAAAVDACVARHGAPRSVVFSQRARQTSDEWQSEMRVSLSATRQVIERLATPIAEAGGGAIVIVGSNADRLVAGEQPVGYHVAKAGLTQMAQYYAVALGPRGIRVNTVVPGSVLKGPDAPVQRDQAIVPLRRVATPDDIAQVVVFLCGPQSACVTGQRIAVDSGLSLLWQGSLIGGLHGGAAGAVRTDT